MKSKSLLWRLLLAFTFITVVAFVGSYGASQVAGQSAEQIVYIPLVSVFDGGTGEEEPPVEPTPTPTPTPEPPAEENVFYLSPSGNDANDGTTESKAWATFSRAWNDLYPGDTLILLDGVYYQSLRPGQRSGQPGNPITIRAKNDGQAVIDGQHQTTPVYLTGGMQYYVIEGIVARRGDMYVYRIENDHNILRRVSGYNADPDSNSKVISLGGTAKYNLIEDCVAYGTGRKMIVIYRTENNVIRRCFADWQRWDGRERSNCWPWGDGIELYNSSHNIIENSISYSRNPTQSINVMAQGGDPAIGNKVLGSMAIMAGMKEDFTPMVWGETRPQPTEYTCVRKFDDWNGQRSGFNVYEGGSVVRDNLWQDNLSWGNAGLGISWIGGISDPNTGNNRISRATVFNNGLDNAEVFGGLGTDAMQADLNHYSSVTDSFIETIYTGSGYTTMSGAGARLTHRYVDGVLTDEPLWPWPMEGRIQAEIGISVTDLISGIMSQLP